MRLVIQSMGVLMMVLLMSGCSTSKEYAAEDAWFAPGEEVPLEASDDDEESEAVGAWVYTGNLHRLIAQADRIVVRDGGRDCCQPVDGQKILFEVTDLTKINAVRENMSFDKKQVAGFCFCCGWPGIDWYKGDQRLALTALKHGSAVTWEGFDSMGYLTEESQAWLKAWLVGHGLSEKAMR